MTPEQILKESVDFSKMTPMGNMSRSAIAQYSFQKGAAFALQSIQSQAISFAQWLEDTDKMKPFEYGSETASLIDNLDALYTLFLTHQSLHP